MLEKDFHRLITQIDKSLNETVFLPTALPAIRFWGLAEKVNKDNQVLVVSNQKGEGTLISFDDTYTLQSFHHVAQPISMVRQEEESFGFEEIYAVTMPMQLVVWGKLSEIEEKTPYSQETLPMALSLALPLRLAGTDSITSDSNSETTLGTRSDTTLEMATICEVNLTPINTSTQKLKVLAETFVGIAASTAAGNAYENLTLQSIAFTIDYRLDFQYQKNHECFSHLSRK